MNSSKPSYGLDHTTLAHELGHTLGLVHTFEAQGKDLLDVPPICSTNTGESRRSRLQTCPEKVLCNGHEEDIYNIMDYMPSFCSREFHFTRGQVQVMQDKLQHFRNPNKFDLVFG